jgi:hypothetical protein
MFGFTFEITLKVKGSTVWEVLEVFRDLDSLVGQ